MNTHTYKLHVPVIPFAFSSLPAALVTIMLVLLMHSLIATDMVPLDEKTIRIASIVLPDEDPIEFRRDQAPAKPDDAVSPPEWVAPMASLAPDDDAAAGYVPVALPAGNDDIVIGTGGGGVVAYLKSQPIYPSRALTRGIEGYVDLSFDITVAGATTNIRVVEAQPKGVFEKAAISALKKWKYKVPVVDEAPQPQVDMMTRMTFELEK